MEHKALENKILKLEKVPLSNHDIHKLTGGKCNVMSYTELLNYKTLDQALGKNGCLVLLYETDEHFGHWVAVIKINENLVEHFDPLSSKPDREWDHISAEYKKKPYLSHLMKESPYQLSYNQYKLQQNKKDINTCGRFCALRVILQHYSLEQFKKILTNPIYDPDFMVTLITEIIK